MTPVNIKLKEKKFLVINWNDNTKSKIKLANLRANCPCASCATDRNERGNSYIPIYSSEQTTIEKIQPVGSYAIAVTWKDNHNTGIYDYRLLKQISNS